MIKNLFSNYGLYIAWILTSVGVLGSLYFSEILHLQPCNLCWYQRIALFPLALFLGVASYRGDASIVRYALPLVLFGLFIALYQVAIQEIPGWNPIKLCGAGPSCSSKTDIGFGFVSLPMLSALNFLTLSLLLFGIKTSLLKK